METIMKIIIILLITLLILIFLLCIVFYNNYLYNAIYNRKKRKLWKFIIKNVDRFEYIYKTEFGAHFIWGYYHAIAWYDNTCSIHINNKCILSNFDKVMSNKMYKLLLDKIK